MTNVQFTMLGHRDTHLDGHVVDVQAEGDALVEGQLGLPGAVDVHGLLGLHITLLVVDVGLNHTIPDGLRQRRTFNTR